jgi:hypothetical protein
MNNPFQSLKFECPFCSLSVTKNSNSGRAGACWQCRKRIIPKHIPETQHKLFIKHYLKEKCE